MLNGAHVLHMYPMYVISIPLAPRLVGFKMALL